MGRAAAAEGIRTIVATPHTPWTAGSVALRTAAVMAPRCRELTFALHSHGVELDVLPGVEVMLDPELPRRIDEGAELTLSGSRAMLVEIPVDDYPAYTEQVIFELQVRGLRVVMAHPERNSRFQQDPALFQRLVERGVLGQLTSRSLSGAYGEEAREAAFLLLEHNLAHVLASDVHGSGPGRPGLRRAIELAAEVVGEERAWAMASDVPARLLADEEMALPEPAPLAGRGQRWWASR